MKTRIRRFLKYSFFISLLILVIGLLLPENGQMPVKGATTADYHPETFWYYPWGKSGTHKGMDIFAEKGTPIHPTVGGIVIATGEIGMGGKYVLVLGPKWRIHYYAHLDEIKTSGMSYVTKSTVIGTVGNTGNAAGKPPHLHYSIITAIPYFWKADDEPQGWKKMFFLNPIEHI